MGVRLPFSRSSLPLDLESNRSASGLAVNSPTISLGHIKVLVDSEAPGLVHSLQRIYSAGFPTAEIAGSSQVASPQTIVYKVQRESDADGHISTYAVVRDGQILYRNCPAEWLTSTLEWDIRDAVSRSLTGYHLIHAGAVAHNGHGVLLPGVSGAGKSTTVAALSLEGFTYCSDELAVVGPNLRLHPFPKIISLKSGGWRQIVQEFPEAVSSLDWPCVADGAVWQVRPPLVPSGRLAREGYPVDFVILPKFAPGQETRLQPIARSAALRELVEQSLDLQLRKAQGFEMLVELVRRADCYSLSVSSLKEAVALVKGLTA